MFGISLLQRSGRAAGPIAAAIRSPHWVALFVSVALHCSLFLFVDTSPVLTGKSKQAVPLSSKVINISLVAVDVTSTEPSEPSAPDALRAEIDDHKAEVSKPSIEPPSPAEPRPYLTFPTFEGLSPPAPYYFQPRELTEKTSGSFDIPPELAAALAGEVPHSASLRLRINESGDVDQVLVDDSTFSITEQQLLIDLFQKKKFEAGKISGQPVKSEVAFQIQVQRGAPGQHPK